MAQSLFHRVKKKKGEHVYCAKINQGTKSGQEPETRVRNICMDDSSGRAV